MQYLVDFLQVGGIDVLFIEIYSFLALEFRRPWPNDWRSNGSMYEYVVQRDSRFQYREFRKKTVHVLDVQGVNKIFLNPRYLSSKIEICKKVQYFVQCHLKWPKNISESSPKVFV